MDSEKIFWILTKFAVYSFIYVLGRVRFDITWFVPLFLTALRDYATRKRELRSEATRAALRLDDRDAVLSRLERLDEIPAWVLFPDYERAEWLNLILKRVWPNLNEIIVKRVRKFEEKLKSRSILSTFKFTKVELGRASPRITGIKVYNQNIPCQDLMIDLTLSYFGDIKLGFSLNGFEGGIKNIETEGAMRIILKQSTANIPFISTIQIYFLRHPLINFELFSALSMLDMFSTGDLIRSILKDQVSKLLVYPNKIKIRLSSDSEDLKMPSINGLVKIKFQEVQEISCDKIFIEMSLGNELRNSEIVDVENEEASINVEYDLVSYNEGDQELEIIANEVGEDGKISRVGRKSIKLHEIKDSKIISGIFSFDSKAKFTAKFSWFEISSEHSENAVLQIYVDSIRSIHSKYRPYIKITIGDEEQETQPSTVKNEITKIEKHLNFLIENPSEKMMELKIMDQLSSTVIDEFNYNLADLLVRKNFEHLLQAFPLIRSVNSEIILTLKLNMLENFEVLENKSDF